MEKLGQSRKSWVKKVAKKLGQSRIRNGKVGKSRVRVELKFDLR